MVTFSKGEDGVWMMMLDETDAQERNPVYDEAVPRYLNAFDPAFVRAAEADEAEFVKALVPVGHPASPRGSPRPQRRSRA